MLIILLLFRKCCKAMPILLIFFLSAYFVAMFALDFQKLWLAIVFLALCLILGPLIFIIHTFCYIETATKLWEKTSLSIYKPCPRKKRSKPKDDDVSYFIVFFKVGIRRIVLRAKC